MSKIRINDLARELEVKSKSILDALTAVGVTEKKTHSSSIEEDEAEKVRGYFRKTGETQKSAAASRVARVDGDGIKTKIDLSHISKPGDVLKAITSKHQPAAAPVKASPVAPVSVPAAENKPAAAPPQPPAAVPQPTPKFAPFSTPAPAPKFVVPSTAVRPTFSVPAPRPAAPPPAAATVRHSIRAPTASAPVSVAPPAAAQPDWRRDCFMRRVL